MNASLGTQQQAPEHGLAPALLAALEQEGAWGSRLVCPQSLGYSCTTAAAGIAASKGMAAHTEADRTVAAEHIVQG